MHPTYAALLAAGVRVAEQHGLAQMSVNAIVAESGVAKGTFYVHFASRAAYLVALHQWFHNDLQQAINAAVAELAPGRERIITATHTYLDACLAARAVKALLLEARSEAAITAEVHKRNGLFAAQFTPDFAALDWDAAPQSARLFCAMVAEAALLELAAGAAQHEVRRALLAYLR